MGTYADLYIDEKNFHIGAVEKIAQQLGLFNGASNGSIRMIDQRLPGHYNRRIQYKNLSGFWTRRDITAASAVTSTDTKKIQELQQIGVKLNRKIFIEDTIDKFKKNLDENFDGNPAEWSRFLGAEVATAKLERQVNDALLSIRAALMGQTTNKHTITVSSANYNGKMNSLDLNKGRALLGDQGLGNAVRVMVMHSKPYFDLVGNQVADKLTGVSDYNLFAGVPATYGIPTLVTDSASLHATIGSGSTAYEEYYNLLLVEDACVLTNSENETMIVQPKTGYENLLVHMQGEAAYNLECKGFVWDITNGGLNPSDAALATTTNWDKTASSYKQLGGAVIVSR